MYDDDLNFFLFIQQAHLQAAPQQHQQIQIQHLQSQSQHHHQQQSQQQQQQPPQLIQKSTVSSNPEVTALATSFMNSANQFQQAAAGKSNGFNIFVGFANPSLSRITILLIQWIFKFIDL